MNSLTIKNCLLVKDKRVYQTLQKKYASANMSTRLSAVSNIPYIPLQDPCLKILYLFLFLLKWLPLNLKRRKKNLIPRRIFFFYRNQNIACKNSNFCQIWTLITKDIIIYIYISYLFKLPYLFLFSAKFYPSKLML